MAETETTDGGARLPQPTEEVHLPDPSYVPVLVALGTTITLVGLITFWPAAIIGAIILVWSIFRWIRMTRREMGELPMEH